MVNILWLGEEEAMKSTLVGGKVANLSRFAADYPVPPGFCIPSTLFHEYGAMVQHNGRVTSEIDGAIRNAYYQLATASGDAALRVAVRSSAVDEDGQDASFAGQHESYLNVVGPDDVIRAVEKCLASAYTDRALVYRKKQNMNVRGIHIAVLVQQLVMADVALVAFSTNPLTKNRNEIVINASWGLGESIVSGTVTPDTYWVERDSMTITSQQIGAKERMTIMEGNGTKEIAVPQVLQSVTSLNESQIQQVAQMAVEIEERMGTSVDIECAYQAEELYLLQSRPITTLNLA